MATKLETFPPSTRGRKSQYPWDQWGDGSIWQLQRGVDFTATAQSMRQNVSKAASQVGKSARTSIVRGQDENGADDTLIVQFVPIDPNKPKRQGRPKGSKNKPKDAVPA